MSHIEVVDFEICSDNTSHEFKSVRKTTSLMTTNEKAMLIAKRVKMFYDREKPRISVDVYDNQGNILPIDMFVIAEKELFAGRNPLTVRRHFLNGEYEDWLASEMRIPE